MTLLLLLLLVEGPGCHQSKPEGPRMSSCTKCGRKIQLRNACWRVGHEGRRAHKIQVPTAVVSAQGNRSL
eukprot:149936-Pelagomonas_calceolata.AAC.11